MARKNNTLTAYEKVLLKKQVPNLEYVGGSAGEMGRILNIDTVLSNLPDSLSDEAWLKHLGNYTANNVLPWTLWVFFFYKKGDKPAYDEVTIKREARASEISKILTDELPVMLDGYKFEDMISYGWFGTPNHNLDTSDYDLKVRALQYFIGNQCFDEEAMTRNRMIGRLEMLLSGSITV